jgi:phosphohistidine phosphatase
LTARGHKQAERTARWLKARLPARHHVLASPAVRAQQTAHALGGRIHTEPRIDVGAGPEDVIAAVRAVHKTDHKAELVLIVGHQPTLGQAAALLLTGSEDDWRVRKSSAWWFREHSGGAELVAVFDPDIEPDAKD